MRAIYVLLWLDATTGAATRPVGVLGLDDPSSSYESWLPYEPGAGSWRERIAGTKVPIERAVRRWMLEADGISWDIAEVTPPEAEDLASAVEKTVDLLLAAAAEEETS